METGVKETPPGTMPEAEGRKGISPDEGRKEISSPEEGKTPEKEKTVSPESPEEEPLLYSQKQSDALILAAKSEDGRKSAERERELTTLKEQILSRENELEDVQAEIKTLEEQINDLTSGDPKKFDLVKMGRDLRERERGLKSKISNFESKETSFLEREKRVNSFELDILIETVAEKYEDGDSGRLKKAIGVFENPTEEQVGTIAEILFSTKAKVSPKTYSGKTDGGGGLIHTRADIAKRDYWDKNKEDILKAQAEPGQPRIK